VFGFDQQAPLVLVGGIQQCQVDAVHFTFGRSNSEPPSLLLAHRTHPTPLDRKPAEGGRIRGRP
jgi:hypothetical protein